MIIGGGPSGLFMANRLIENGISCCVLEKRLESIAEPRAIFLHEPILKVLSDMDLADKFMAKGARNSKTRLFYTISNRKTRPASKLLETSFLAIFQSDIETLLKEKMTAHPESPLIEGSYVQRIEQDGEKASVMGMDAFGEPFRYECRFAIACDGVQSEMRRQLNMRRDSFPYRDSFATGFFQDFNSAMNEAQVFLHPQGAVESAGMPDGLRFWLIRTFAFYRRPSLDEFRSWINERTNEEIRGDPPFPLQSHGIQKRLMRKLYSGRVLFAGDAAHTISSLARRNLNICWANACLLGDMLTGILRHGEQYEPLFERYSETTRRLVIQAIRRSEMNMRLCRRYKRSFFRKPVVRAVLTLRPEIFISS